MNRIRWYGSTMVLLVTAALVIAVGPRLAQQIAWAQAGARMTLIKNALEQNSTLSQLSDAFRNVAQLVEPSVVHIQVSIKQRAKAPSRSPKDQWLWRFFGPQMEPRWRRGPWWGDQDRQDDQLEQDDHEDGWHQDLDRYNVPHVVGSGSGWVFDEHGHVITNFHVVKGADSITVRFHDGTERKATVVGTDPKTDIAVIKISGGRLHPATLASEPAEQGDIVFAFGSPFGFEFSVSQGIVSAKGRQLGILSRGGYEDFIQTDAAINRGNSGGPLTNIYGHVVGMNTAIASRSNGFQGLGFAIPVAMVQQVVEQLIDHGKVSRGYLGIYIADLESKLARTFGYDGQGVLVEEPIDGGPAEEAGIQRGDIITKIDGEPVGTANDLRQTVASYSPGTELSLEVFRSGQTLTVTIDIGQLPDEVASATPQKDDGDPGVAKESNRLLLRKLGIGSVATFTREAAKRLDIAFTPGVFVRSVRRDSAADAAGITQGQIITAVMGVRVKTAEELVEQLKVHDLASGLRMSVVDGDMKRFVFLELPDQ